MFVKLLFYVFSIVLVMSALGVITARNPIHAVLLLVLAFFNSAALWLLLEAEFFSHCVNLSVRGCCDGVVLICGDDVRY